MSLLVVFFLFFSFLKGREKKKEWEVKEILFHPKYDLNAKKAKGIPEFYDYDVALIRLKEKLKYETTIR